MPASEPYTNRLIHEKSPYLLQHAHNPVDWYPWGEEAFEKARAEEKFILLSIGYSTCHWCHVMERESFEDPETAEVLNAVCVPIKVDREERPDVDQVYMGVCQAITGSGGWPLNVFMTADRLPFFAGTYFPKESRYGRLGLIDLLRKIGVLWKNEPAKLIASGQDIVQRLKGISAASGEPQDLSADVLDSAVETFRGRFDARRGGFGSAPKFPTPHNLNYLIRRHRRTADAEMLQMAEVTLQAMRRGGIWDHVGFGFHRYSTDENWLLPHFEKMLYDQAGLATAYLEAYQATRKPEYAETTRRICEYVLRDMTAPEGGFYSAEDADSEGVEGKFYVWTRDEIVEVLGAEATELFCRIFSVAQEGNYREEAGGRQDGTNIPHLDRSIDEWAQALDTTPEALVAGLETLRQTLFEHREARIHPHKDDKIITSWNGLMISALARAAWVFDEPEYARAAGRAADFILDHMREGRRLLRRHRDGEAAISAFAEDYAFLGLGLVDLYRASFEPVRLAQARELAGELITLFWDEAGGGLFDTASDAEELVIRPRELFDGATPSANSVALELFARLGLLTADPAWTEKAREIGSGLAGRLGQYAAGFTQFLQGAELLLEPTREVVIAGNRDAPDTRALVETLRSGYAPETTVLLRTQGAEGEAIATIAPFTAEMGPVNGLAAAYVCENFACRTPITDPAELARALAEAR